ncbi:hypothetical protein [Bradyrhizobium genosp. A]
MVAKEIRLVKYAEGRLYAGPEAAARKLVELAASIEPIQDGRIFVGSSF